MGALGACRSTSLIDVIPGAAGEQRIAMNACAILLQRFRTPSALAILGFGLGASLVGMPPVFSLRKFEEMEEVKYL
jgi:hypothetical protein